MLVVMFLITMIRRGYLNQLHKVARFNRHTAVSPRGELGSNTVIEIFPTTAFSISDNIKVMINIIVSVHYH